MPFFLEDMTYCGNERCKIKDKCVRNYPPKDLKHIWFATFGPANGDLVKSKKDCDYFIKK